ncbi:anaerobic ribonucleoside triphosphate reductase [compost metagenome]
MMLNFTQHKDDLTSTTGIQFVSEILDHIRLRMKEFQEETGNLYNLEATPAEGTTYRFAKEDKKRFPDIIQAGQEENIYYTNSSQIPVDYTEDPFEALYLQDSLQCKYTGGTVLHLYMSEKISTPQACKNFVKKVLTNFKLPYITVTPVFSICPVHGYLNGEHEYCPKCDNLLLTEHNLNSTANEDYTTGVS